MSDGLPVLSRDPCLWWLLDDDHQEDTPFGEEVEDAP